MRRLFAVSTFAIFTILISITVVFALDSGILEQDSFVRITIPDQSYDTADLSVAGSTTNCNPTDTIYLGFDGARVRFKNL